MFKHISRALTVTAGAYSANDVVGELITLHGIGLSPGIRLHSIIISDLAAQNVDYILTVFNAAPTDLGDNAAMDPADADLPKIIWEKVIDAATYRRAYVDNSIHRVDNLDQPLVANNTAGTLYAMLWTTGTPTYASTGDIDVTFLYSEER